MRIKTAYRQLSRADRFYVWLAAPLGLALGLTVTCGWGLLFMQWLESL